MFVVLGGGSRLETLDLLQQPQQSRMFRGRLAELQVEFHLMQEFFEKRITFQQIEQGLADKLLVLAAVPHPSRGLPGAFSFGGGRFHTKIIVPIGGLGYNDPSLTSSIRTIVGTEIERKFLVKGYAWRDQATSQVSYRQGYLAKRENATVRVRIGGDRAFLTIKGQVVGISRPEYEYEIPVDEAEEMLESIALRPSVEKVRYFVPFRNHLWEVDLFLAENAGLVVAEIELSRPNEEFERPDWLGREVTGDPRYYNSSLISNPYNQW